jgi:serine/threonine protein kinase
LRTIPLLSKNHSLVQARLRNPNQGSSNELFSPSHSEGSSADLSENTAAELFEGKYDVLEKLGEGSSGVVHRCRRRSSGEDFAVKSFSFEEEHVPGLKSNFLVQKGLSHPSIISYEGLYLDMRRRQGWLVMEYVEWPSLREAGPKGEQELRAVMRQLLEALDYLHRKRIVHRDIQPENVLYNQSTGRLKIIDFGISRRFRRRGALFDMWTITGTLYYRAPEMFHGGYREAVDVWAAAVLLYKLASGKTPFESDYHHQTIKNITSADLLFPASFDPYTHEFKALLKRMLHRSPKERPAANSCLRDIWFYEASSRLGQSRGSLRLIEEADENCRASEL